MMYRPQLCPLYAFLTASFILSQPGTAIGVYRVLPCPGLYETGSLIAAHSPSDLSMPVMVSSGLKFSISVWHYLTYLNAAR